MYIKNTSGSIIILRLFQIVSFGCCAGFQDEFSPFRGSQCFYTHSEASFMQEIIESKNPRITSKDL